MNFLAEINDKYYPIINIGDRNKEGCFTVSILSINLVNAKEAHLTIVCNGHHHTSIKSVDTTKSNLFSDKIIHKDSEGKVIGEVKHESSLLKRALLDNGYSEDIYNLFVPNQLSFYEIINGQDLVFSTISILDSDITNISNFQKTVKNKLDDQIIPIPCNITIIMTNKKLENHICVFDRLPYLYVRIDTQKSSQLSSL